MQMDVAHCSFCSLNFESRRILRLTSPKVGLAFFPYSSRGNPTGLVVNEAFFMQP